MKGPTFYFQKMSLTRQILTIILTVLIFFIMFFFVFVSDNIDRTITKQMYELILNRQTPIVAVIDSKQTNSLNDVYAFLASDSVQTNCLIQNGRIDSIANQNTQQKNVNRKVYDYLLDQSQLMDAKSEGALQGTVTVASTKYYYRMIYCHDGIILASFMDDTYATQFRDSLINSTVYVIVIAFMIVFLIILMWVFSIIHPLNLIRDYIEQIKDGKEVELRLNRDDEIGEMANAIVKMNDELKKQDKAKEDMIHNISHDLKTPIATIKSYAESIKDGIYPYGTLESSVDVILDNAQRLENKVHSLLYMNRVEYLVASDAEGVVTNMKDVVEQVVLNSAVIRPEIQVITDVEEVFFDGLIEAWRVAIENIMENAFRYAKSYIKIEVREDWLCISNDGPKMPEDRIESLFRPYEKGEGGRFGLGLSIVFKVCKANHYIVKGENSDDGVRFIIYRKVKKQRKKKENNWVKTKGEKA
ncbi:HAMP domain-containing sensor histidine kinase [uncultured Holdemanella sp.]|uniref:HAMP domain-containing sensor histidine kinase n=1 Tax=uncultured Holdemanella sp. TaxID=1763549 RepID=UPI0025D17816|nr:HAMP domain-containing sensor histidine kinase [uncultured Holdemanella sp.]